MIIYKHNPAIFKRGFTLAPSVSVVLAAHSHHPYLEAAINSVLNQTLEDFELLIVANNCSEELYEQLQQFNDPRIRLFRTSLGQLAFNLNYAIDKAEAEYIARMDSDDISDQKRLQLQLNFMRQNPQVDVLGTSFRLIDEQGQVIGEKKTLMDSRLIRKKLPYGNPICHPSVMMKKEVVLKAGGYLGGRLSEDYGLWLRLARDEKTTFHNLSQSLLNYRIRKGQARGQRLSYAEAAGLIWTEFLLRPSWRYFLGAVVSSLKILKAKKE